ncbi:uncharacterized protein LOC123554514 [Mercenaria mercenaria]|uniref:uncharacterized protein LOC123554514 n=1 Tax=Mercenaria mercenaria TaxID=6596 RepID=UPI00234E3C5B|nr:uncharacterized protein LOC123554514 [Mercenaria mercenaria]
MKPISYILILLQIYSVFCDSTTTDDKKAEYMEIFSIHQHWEGYYGYNGTRNYCMLFIHSEHYLKKGGLLATFKDRLGATVEMEGEQYGSSELDVIFTVHLMFDNVNRFPENFTFRSTLYQQNDLWHMKSNVTVPKNGLFGEILLHQTDSTVGPWFDDGPEPWRYFVIIGIPIILAVIGVSGTVGLIYWGIKRGYIRHVPKSYNNFNNPVQFSANRDNVHI